MRFTRSSIFCAALGLCATGLAAPPSVTIGHVHQLSETSLVFIVYALADPDSPTLRVSLQISSDGGATWNVPVNSASGTGIGDSVQRGNGKVISWNAGADWPGYDGNLRFRVLASDDIVPAGMALIPAGSFAMGNSTNSTEGGSDELPVHTVNVSTFYMDRYEVTKQLWDEVKAWGSSEGRGYGDLPPGGGKGSNHPVHTISWYDVVKWCNARSQKDNLTPVYYTNDAQTVIYKTGNVNVSNAQVKWSARGYRLPTEAEWEKAARGGLSAQRFPWGATATHGDANYTSSASFSYDISPTRGYHPTYAVGDTPFTSPVGAFSPNASGIYDMAGNAREWCWDWYSSTYYSISIVGDPPGASTGTGRMVRGGAWFYDAAGCRVADRATRAPTFSADYLGFRSVRR